MNAYYTGRCQFSNLFITHGEKKLYHVWKQIENPPISLVLKSSYASEGGGHMDEQNQALLIILDCRKFLIVVQYYKLNNAFLFTTTSLLKVGV